MGRYVEGQDRRQAAFLPDCLDDYVDAENPVRVIDAFVDELDLAALGFERARPAATGRPAYHPAMMLKLYVYGYMNRVLSSRRLEREASRNVELIWLTGKLAPDFKTPTSGGTTPTPSRRPAGGSWGCAAASACSAARSSRWTAAASRR